MVLLLLDHNWTITQVIDCSLTSVVIIVKANSLNKQTVNKIITEWLLIIDEETVFSISNLKVKLQR